MSMAHSLKRKGPAPLTIEEMQAIAASRGGRCLSTHYVNTNTHLEWECAEGHRWLAIPNNVKCGAWCRTCAHASQRGSLAGLQRIASARGGRCLSTEYVNNRTHLLWECAEGHRWHAVPASVKNGTWCSICAKARTRVPLAEVQRAAIRLGGRCLSDNYVSGVTRLLFECAAGHRWQALPISVRRGHWCPRCMHDGRRKTLEQMQAIAASRGGQCLSDAYINQRQKLRWRCAAGHEWESSANAVRDHWCPRCRDERRRLGIDLMRELAASHGGQCLSDTYAGAHEHLEWQCAKGHRWRATPNGIRSGHWCPTCNRKRYTVADMQALARSRGGECLSTTYVSVRVRLEWLCALGHAWWTAPMVVLNGSWCPQCAHLSQTRSETKRRRHLAMGVAPHDIASRVDGLMHKADSVSLKT